MWMWFVEVSPVCLGCCWWWRYGGESSTNKDNKESYLYSRFFSSEWKWSLCLSLGKDDGCGSIKWMKVMLPPLSCTRIAPHLHGSIGDTEGVTFPTSQYFSGVHSAETLEAVVGAVMERANLFIYKSTSVPDDLQILHLRNNSRNANQSIKTSFFFPFLQSCFITELSQSTNFNALICELLLEVLQDKSLF